MELKRVVVTGLGSLTPIGNTVDEFWHGLISGTSGAVPITYFDISKFKTKFACELKNFNVTDHMERKEARKLDKFAQYAMVSTHEAILDSKIDLNTINKDRVGVIWGSGIGGIETFEENCYSFFSGDGTPRFNPFFIPKMIVDIAAGCISMKYGFAGPNYATVSACASSTHAIIDSLNTIRLGKADMIVTGGSEAPITKAGIGGFNALHALSVRNQEPTKASRPFDKDRDGFVMGEGSGTIILEEYHHAVKRGATIYAEFKGGGMSGDAYHLTAPHPEGKGAINVMKNCLDDANILPENIDTINLHGTSTPLGDIAELKAVKEVFKDHTYNMNINSTKSMTGHLLGATGVIEAISCILSINKGIIPPTINLDQLDEQIDGKLNLTPNMHNKEK